MAKIKKAILLAFGLGLGLAMGAKAQDAGPNGLPRGFVPCRNHDAAQEKADLDLARNTIKVMQAHDMAKLDATMPDLRAALNRAPDVPTLPEVCGDKVIAYTPDMSEFMAISAMVSSGKVKGVTSAEMRYEMPYATLGFIVGWIEFEHQDFANALKDYAKGLRNDPDRLAVETEYVGTLAKLGRNAEALESIDAFMTEHTSLNGPQKGLILRKRGYVLVELGRWDEADAAYRQSLVADPNNQLAKNELDYIAKHRPDQPKT